MPASAEGVASIGWGASASGAADADGADVDRCRAGRAGGRAGRGVNRRPARARLALSRHSQLAAPAAGGAPSAMATRRLLDRALGAPPERGPRSARAAPDAAPPGEGLLARLAPAVDADHPGGAAALAWTARGGLLASAGDDCRVRLWSEAGVERRVMDVV